MAKRGPDQDDNFLSRWSQRKRAARSAPPETAADGAAPGEGGAAGSAASAPESRPVAPEDLPDIESLDASSDFSVFMRQGVPEGLKKRALRKLWQVDPAFKHICMLDDYNLDYTDAAMVVPDLKTIYKIGRGMVLPEEEEAAARETAAADAVPGKDPAAGGALAGPVPAAQAGQGAPDPQDQAADDAPQGAPEQAHIGPADRRRKARDRGDSLADSAPTLRRRASRAPERSALSRRWGDGET